MSLSIGIVGLPNVGKSTLFNALLKKQAALAANYPFATIEPNVGIVPVPDSRLHQLSLIIQQNTGITPPLNPATVKFVDIAGLVKGASEGEGLGNKFLAHIREVDAIALVLRHFENADVVETGTGDLKTDYEILLTELILADIQTLNKQLPPKGSVTPDQKNRWQSIEALKSHLNQNQPAFSLNLSADSADLIKDLCLLTIKKLMVIVNIGESELSGISLRSLESDYATSLNLPPENVIAVCAQIESDLAALSADEQHEYLLSVGLESPGLERVIKTGYNLLNLISFLTAGEKEVRAWTIGRSTTAQLAAGVIHTDFIKKFIRAEIVPYLEFIKNGGWKGSRDAGKARLEGRDYLIQDGDVVEFKIGA